ncbi:MAG: lasso peptide biosynthesis B2 protein [Novosphingobium sp.]
MARLRAPIGLRRIWRDKWLFMAAFAVLWRSRIELSFKGFGDPRRGCGAIFDLPPPPPVLAARVAWAVDRAARLVVRPTCLVRAMAGQRLLHMKGHGSAISVGIRSDGETGFEAHAWLCAGDAIILGDSAGEVQQYRPLLGIS